MQLQQNLRKIYDSDHYPTAVLIITISFLVGWAVIDFAAGEKDCYGIYCDRDDGEIDLEKQQEIWDDIQRTRNYIAIQISKSCQISGTCPTYKELADMYDNSDKYLSGDFYLNNRTGLWEREEPPIFNSFEYYRFMNLPWIVFVDPDDYTWDRSKQIVIHSDLVYQDSRDVFENQILTQYVGLKMDGCKSASIGWTNDGETILFEVLNYFYKKCKGSLDYDPKVEIFVNSTIFPDCDRECFYYKDLLKKELKVDQRLELEAWEKANCDDEKENKYTDLTDYEKNKEECDRINLVLGEDIDDDKEQDCYGIYCDRDDDDDDKDKTASQIRADRLREIQEIEDCKEEQIWDEERKDGTYRRLLFDCNDDEEREEYYDIILCESFGYEDIKNEDDEIVDCYDEDERNEKIKKIKKDIEIETPPIDKDIALCEAWRTYEFTIPDRVERASIVTCEDENERDEYLQEMEFRYPDGLPDGYKVEEPVEEEKEKVKCYGIHCKN
ncbi:MAG: hypothetical protein GTO02_10090 [Candidatus Dadabacteria bacterium]|nr:hypothetical protein [Candidatus Dadabacteria bacterium]